MTAINGRQKYYRNSWQKDFVKLLPQIEQLLAIVFRHLGAQAKDEAVQNGIVLAMLSYMRLHQRNRVRFVSASSLTWYAVLQVKCGRPAGVRMNVRDPLSGYAQCRRSIRVARLETYDAGLEMKFLREIWQCLQPEPDRAVAIVCASLGKFDDGDVEATIRRLWHRAIRLLRQPELHAKLNRLARELEKAGRMTGEEVIRFLGRC